MSELEIRNELTRLEPLAIIYSTMDREYYNEIQAEIRRLELLLLDHMVSNNVALTELESDNEVAQDLFDLYNA